MSNHRKLKIQQNRKQKHKKTLLNRDTQVNQLIILTEQKQKHVIIIKGRTKYPLFTRCFHDNKQKIREGNIKKSLVCKRFCLGAATKQNENREPGNERVNQPVTRIVISRQKALEKNVNKRAREVEVFMDDERD